VNSAKQFFQVNYIFDPKLKCLTKKKKEFLIGDGGKKFPTLEIQMPTNNFIVLEILNRDSNVPKGSQQQQKNYLNVFIIF